MNPHDKVMEHLGHLISLLIAFVICPCSHMTAVFDLLTLHDRFVSGQIDTILSVGYCKGQ